MAVENKTMRLGFLSTYSPRECGLATFTEDLATEINQADHVQVSVIAVVEKERPATPNDPLTKCSLLQYERDSYTRAALWANTHLDLLVIEHEYGIYGGKCGAYILELAQRLTIPFAVTLHTILSEPSAEQKAILQALGKLAAKVIAMAENSIPILVATYEIARKKIVCIPHGVPVMALESRAQLKRKLGLQGIGLQGKTVVSSFGLLSPSKGLEYGIEAVANVAADYHTLVYLILGRTHPQIRESAGEEYRQSLMDLVQYLGMRDHIFFVDQYLSKEALLTYLHISDIYLTPYLSKEQAVSGTLAYAMGCGKVVISTPYRYAEEMLRDGRGLLARFKDAASIAACMRTLLENPAQKSAMEQKALALGRTMTWPAVAAQYLRIFLPLLPHPRAAAPVKSHLPLARISSAGRALP